MGKRKEWRKLAEAFSLIRLLGKDPSKAEGPGWSCFCEHKRKFEDIPFQPNENAGVACGPASGVIVLDVDLISRFAELQKENPEWETPATFTVQGRKKGCHLYYKYPDNSHEYGNRAYTEEINGKSERIFDIKGIGGQVVAPFSIHPDTGQPYTIVRDLPIAECPQWIMDLARKESSHDTEGFSGSGSWDGDIESLPISEDSKTLIVNGAEKGARSERMMTILNALAYSELSDSEINGIFNRYAIGEKYREKGRGKERWLKKQIDDARRYVGDQTFSYFKKVSESKQSVESKPEYAREAEGKQEGKQKVSKEMNLAHEVREWVNEGGGRFHVTELDRELGLKTRSERNNRSKILNDLVKSGIIEKTGTIKGYYQCIDQDCEKIDFMKCDTDIYPVKLPFNLHNMIRVMPGNILVVAGEPNVGKTALLINTVKLNNKEREILYFTSEMGAQEFRERLLLFPDMKLEDWEFDARNRSGNFHQVINPDALNIIDFLEVHDEFYKVGLFLRQIHERLRNGIAIVAIQKNAGTDVGRGGMMGLEKPRLYLALSRNHPHGNIAKIVKAKNYSGQNPNGKQIEFKLHKGTEIQTLTSWSYANAQ